MLQVSTINIAASLPLLLLLLSCIHTFISGPICFLRPYQSLLICAHAKLQTLVCFVYFCFLDLFCYPDFACLQILFICLVLHAYITYHTSYLRLCSFCCIVETLKSEAYCRYLISLLLMYIKKLKGGFYFYMPIYIIKPKVLTHILVIYKSGF